jgi:hypothetical protein
LKKIQGDTLEMEVEAQMAGTVGESADWFEP